LRAKAFPTVSTPLTWDEVKKAVKRNDLKLLSFQTGDVLKRMKKMGDLFAPVLTLKQKLPKITAVR
jgi:bifunctional non-homologous end joining protein LigD